MGTPIDITTPVCSLTTGGPALAARVIVLVGVRLGLGLVDGSRSVLGWCIQGDQSQRCIAPIEEVVTGASPNEDEVVRAHLAHRAIESDLRPSLEKRSNWSVCE